MLARRSPCMSFVQHDVTNLTTVDLCDVLGCVTIDMLPDEVLLGIFGYSVGEEECKRWRCHVLGHPVVM
jgi:hypothetical protein